MQRIIIGNLISGLAAIAFISGCCMKTPRKVYFMQILENLILCVSSAVFGSWAGISTLAISAVRNYLVMEKRYSKNTMIFFCILLTVCGVLVNNRGAIGLLVVLATAIYTVASYYVKSILAIKWNLLINTILWGIYFFCIYDFLSGIVQTVTAVILLVTIFQIRYEGKRTAG